MNLVPPPNSPTSSQFSKVDSVFSLLIIAIGQSPTPNENIAYPNSNLLNATNINVE